MLYHNKNKKGWIKIIEAFIALLLITSALLIVVQKGYTGKKDISEKVYEAQLAVLREIQLDTSLREKILDNSLVLPYEVTSISLSEIYTLVNSQMPDYLDCTIAICELDSVCGAPLATPLDKDIYAQAVAIATTPTNSNLRQLKLFCWRK